MSVLRRSQVCSLSRDMLLAHQQIHSAGQLEGGRILRLLHAKNGHGGLAQHEALADLLAFTPVGWQQLVVWTGSVDADQSLISIAVMVRVSAESWLKRCQATLWPAAPGMAHAAPHTDDTIRRGEGQLLPLQAIQCDPASKFPHHTGSFRHVMSFDADSHFTENTVHSSAFSGLLTQTEDRRGMHHGLPESTHQLPCYHLLKPVGLCHCLANRFKQASLLSFTVGVHHMRPQ